MSNYKTIYNTETGIIVRTRDISDVMVQRYIDRTPNTAVIDGLVKNPSTKIIDLDTLEVIDKPVVTNIPRYIRQTRQSYLDGSDWTQSPDSPLSDSKKAEWATYRQELRDLPATTYPTIDDIVWPTKP